MVTEQRVIVGGRKPLGQAAGRTVAAPTEAAPEPPATKKRKRGLLVVVAAVVVIAVAAAAWFLLLAPGEEPATHEEVELGEVMTVDPVSLNLANGHYLRLGLALQLTADAGAHGEPTSAPALDAAIALFSGRDIAEVTDPAVREQLTAELARQLAETYHGDVVDVYLTEYVTQ
jgi:flagellar protein FliL